MSIAPTIAPSTESWLPSIPSCGALAAKVAVAEEDILGAGVLYVLDYIFGGTHAISAAQIEPFGAELTLHGASTGRHQRESFERPVFGEIELVPARKRQPRNTGHLRSLVNLLQAPVYRVLEHL